MLLPFRYKIPGLILIFTGLILTILFLTVDFRFEMPVFAIISSYMETKLLTTFRTNFADELIMLVLLTGFSLVVFSEEKNEKEFFNALRIRALVKTVVYNIAILLISILFIYGNGFLGVVIANIFLPFIIYLAIFNFMKLRRRKSEA